MPSFPTLVLRKSLDEIAENNNRKMLEEEILPDYLPKHRWFAGKDRRIDTVEIERMLRVPAGTDGDPWLLALLAVRQNEQVVRYQLPLAVDWRESMLKTGSPLLPWTLAKTRRFRYVGALHDATMDDGFARRLAALMSAGDTSDEGLRARAWGDLAEMSLGDEAAVQRFGVEQSNSSVIIGEQVALKVYRKIATGVHPELEIAQYLSHEAGYANTPALLGSLEYMDDAGEPALLAIAQQYLFNQGDGWQVMVEYLDRELEMRALTRSGESGEAAGALADSHEQNLALVERLGQRIAEMHRAFARPTERPAFTPETAGGEELDEWVGHALRQVDDALGSLERNRAALEGRAAAQADAVLQARTLAEARIRAAGELDAGVLMTRLHGDLHLGQVLVVERDFYVIDFEGEPARDLAARRNKSSALRDVAGMLRSFDYAAWSAAYKLMERRPDATDTILADALAWRDQAVTRFLDGYREHLGDCDVWPGSEEDGWRLLDLFLLEKAFYELGYELANRPQWLDIPLAGIVTLLNSRRGA